MGNKCKLCGAYRPEYFEETKHEGFCDRCEDIFNYWLKQLREDISVTVKAEKGEELSTNDFEKAVLDFIGW